MERFTTNWVLYATRTCEKKQTQTGEPRILPRDVQKKLKSIKKAFS